MTDFHHSIDLNPGDLSIENVPAVFALEREPADWSVGFAGGVWATLEYITLGGLSLSRDDVLRMVGMKALTTIEADISERLSNPVPGGIAAE